MRPLPKHIETYLAKRANPQYHIYKEPERTFKAIVVIPVIQEYANLKKLIESLSASNDVFKEQTLILFCVNNSVSSDEEVKADNLETINFLKQLVEKNEYGLNINFVDASTEGNALPEKDAGVGLARKTGADVALNHFDFSARKNIIIYLDGDCEVEPNYLEAIIACYDKYEYDAAAIDYHHPLDNEAIVAYEVFLRYFILALKYADSSYAYHSVGSTITLTPETYVKIGGMNKKKAGEDFYFLEKISKVTKINSIRETIVHPAARKSWRVPFGTGKSITKFYENSKEEYLLYAPEIFVLLKEWNKVFHSSNDIEFLLNKAKELDTGLYSFLLGQNFAEVMGKIVGNSSKPEQIEKQKIVWFDAFKTMKFVHFLRDNGYANEPMFTALNKMFQMCGVAGSPEWSEPLIPPLEIQIKYLEILRKVI